MRKRIAKVMVLVMAIVMCTGMVAMAAPSPSAGIVTEVKKVVDANGNDLTGKIVIQEVPEEYKEVAEAVQTTEGMKDALVQAGVVWNENLVVADVLDVSIVGHVDVVFPITITFSMKGVTSSSKVVVLRWTGTEWESLEVSVGEGSVSVTFTSLSPVVFVVDKTTTSDGVSGITSPKTSASSTAVIALLGLGAAVLATGMKKKSVLR